MPLTSPLTVGQYYSSQPSQFPIHSEPMNTGSPPSPYTSLAGNSGNQYLPGFLMAGPNSASVAATASPSTITFNRESPAHTAILNSGARKSLLQQQFGGLNYHTDHPGRKHMSPPTQSLWASNPPAKSGVTLTRGKPLVEGRGGMIHSTPTATAHRSALLNTIPNSPSTACLNPPLISSPSVANRSLLSPEYLASALGASRSDAAAEEENTSNCWVTVFGYPLSQSSFILSQFAHFGSIQKHVLTNGGNWMHIKYQSPLQVKCALSKNGKVFADNIMVGVRVCSDKQVMQEDKSSTVFCSGDGGVKISTLDQPSTKSYTQPLTDVSNLRSSTGLREDPLSASFCVANVGRSPMHQGVARHNSMRSLSGDYRTNQLSRMTSVRRNGEVGLFSKAFGYVFGWS